MPSVYVLPDQRLVERRPAEAILPAALRARIPFAHACGGRASCSTCRVVVLEGWKACSERTPKERAIAERLGFDPEFRLACQTRISGYGGSFNSVAALIEAIELWASHWNDDPKPFLWHTPAKKFIAKVRRGRAALTHQTKSATHH